MTALVIAVTVAAALAFGSAASASSRSASGLVIAVDADAGTLLIEGLERDLRLVAVDPMAAIRDWKQRELAFSDIAAGDIVEYDPHWFGAMEIAVDVRVTRMATAAVADADEP